MVDLSSEKKKLEKQAYQAPLITTSHQFPDITLYLKQLQFLPVDF